MVLLSQICTTYCESTDSVRSEHTQRLLEHAIRRYSEWLGHEAELDDLSDRNLISYMRSREKQGMAHATIERESAKLLTLWRYAALNGWVKPPTVRIRKAKCRTPRAYSRSELRRLFSEAKRTKRTIRRLPGNVFWPAMLYSCWDSGERINGVREIRRDDFDLIGRWLTLRNRKGNGEVLVKKLRRRTVKYVRALLVLSDAEKPFAIVSKSAQYKSYKEILKDAGLATDRDSLFHRIRKSHASHLHRRGGDAAESLGNTPEVCRKHYLDPRLTGGKQAADLLFDPLSVWSRLRELLGG